MNGINVIAIIFGSIGIIFTLTGFSLFYITINYIADNNDVTFVGVGTMGTQFAIFGLFIVFGSLYFNRIYNKGIGA